MNFLDEVGRKEKSSCKLKENNDRKIVSIKTADGTNIINEYNKENKLVSYKEIDEGQDYVDIGISYGLHFEPYTETLHVYNYTYEEKYYNNGNLKSIVKTNIDDYLDDDMFPEWEERGYDLPNIEKTKEIYSKNMKLQFSEIKNKGVTIDIICQDKDGNKISREEFLKQNPEFEEEFKEFQDFMGIDYYDLQLDDNGHIEIDSKTLEEIQRKREVEKEKNISIDKLEKFSETADIGKVNEFLDESLKEIDSRNKEI